MHPENINLSQKEVISILNDINRDLLTIRECYIKHIESIEYNLYALKMNFNPEQHKKHLSEMLDPFKHQGVLAENIEKNGITFPAN